MTETFKLEDVLNVLINLETQGNVNYTHLAKNSNNPVLHGFFDQLADQELHHKAIYEGFKKDFVHVEQNEVTPEYAEYVQVLLENCIRFLNGKATSTDLLDSYDLAITLEKDTILLLNELKCLIPSSFHGKIDTLINEERGHLKFLYENPIV